MARSATGNLRAVSVLAVGLACLAVQAASAAEFTHPTQGYRLQYPDTWRAVVVEDLAVLMSFREYLHGGLIPVGGVAINIQVLPPDQTDDTALAKLNWQGNGRRSAERLRSGSAERLDYTGDSGPAHQYQYIALAKRIGSKQFLFILECHAGDPRLSEWEKMLTDAVDSVSVETGAK